MKLRISQNRLQFIEALEGRKLLSGTYDVAGDFLLTSNPNGPWSYGEIATGGFSLDAIANGQWQGSHSQSFNASSIVEGNGSGFNGFATGPVVLMDSGVNSGVEATVRWTAPSAGTYSIQGVFTPMNASGFVPVQVLQNGAPIASGTISQPNDIRSPANSSPVTVAINQSVTVKSGDFIDFVVAHDSSDGYGQSEDNAELQAAITQTSSGGGGSGGSGGIANTSSLQVTSSGRLPSAVLAGAKIAPITQIAHISNSGSSTVDGAVTVSLLLSSDPSGVSGGTLATSVTRKINLKTHKSISIPITLRSLPAGVSGPEYILTEVTDPSGGTTFSASATTMAINPPEVDLSGTFGKLAASARAGQKTAFTLTVLNSGTTPAEGDLVIDLQASPDGLLDAGSIDLGTATHRISIKPGKRLTIRQTETLPTTGGSYHIVASLDPNNVFNDANTSNNVFASSTAITIS